MSQHDMNIANQGFPAFRADLNNALGALATTSAGATEPSTTFANQFWYDSTDNLLKMRNSDNDAWITLAYFDQTNDEWEVRSAVIQAVDSAGVAIKADDGTVGLTVEDDGTVEIEGALAPIGGITNLIRVQTFTSSGTYTPSTNATKIQVFVQGGGGGGGGADSDAGGEYGAGGGGGAGALIVSDIISIDPDTYTSTITVGAGGTGGNGDNAGTNGGDSIFDDGTIVLTADQGYGGNREVDRTVARFATRGLGGNYSNAQSSATNHTPIIKNIGGHGGVGIINAGDAAAGGKGGYSYFSDGGFGGKINTSGANDGGDGLLGAGGGGAASGGAQTNSVGGDGGDGIVMIYEYL